MKLVIGLVLCALAGTASAEEPSAMERAATAAEELRFEEAAGLLEEAWRAGTDDPARVRQLAALAGEVSATMGDRASAMRWFSLLAAIDPDAALPRGTSPKVLAVLEEARAALGGSRFAIRLRPDRARRVVRVGHADPLGAVAAIRLRRAQDDDWSEHRAGPVEIPWRRGAVEIELADKHGNLLHRERLEVAAPPPAALAAATTARAAPRPRWYARWPAWAGLAGGLGVAAGVLAVTSASTSRELESLHRESDMHQAGEALALERRMKTTAVAAQVAGAGAAVAAAVAVVFWRRERRLTVTPMTTDAGGVGASFEVRF